MEEKRQQSGPRQAAPGPTQGGNRPGRSPQGGRGRGGFGRGGSGGRGRLRQGGPKPHQAHPVRPDIDTKANPDEKPIPPLAPGNIRIIPLGGVEEIGRNMTLVEYGDDIIAIDCGFQFREADTPGVDYILPNTKYMEERRDKVRALFITHGHLDHIGGIPYIIDRIGYPPVYTRSLTAVMIRKRQEEFPNLKPLDIKEVEKADTVKAGNLRVKFFSVTHTIPDAMGVIVETPYGDLVFTGDLRLDHVDGVPTETEEKEFSFFAGRNVLFLAADSTNVERPGFSLPERVVKKNK